MRSASILALLLVAAGLAGCLGATDGPAATPPPQPGPNLTDPIRALQADMPAANVEQLDRWSQGGTEEIDPVGDHLLVDRGSDVFVLNTSSPGAIGDVGSVALPSVVDVKASDDGNFAFAADDQSASGAPLGGTGPFTGGVYVLNISEKSDPAEVGYHPVGWQRGPHMLYYHRMPDGRELIFGAAGPDVVVLEFDRSDRSLEELARYSPGQQAQAREPKEVGPLYNPQGWVHDMVVQTTPDGRTLMYVAAWDAGLRVVDVTDPEDPRELGAWRDFGDREAGNLHTVATERIGDRRVTVGAVEVGFGVVGGTAYAKGEEKPVTYVWDTTDPTDPKLVGKWVNPVKDEAGRDYAPGEQVDSTHNLQLEDGRIYQAHYDLGVWVIDVSTPANRTEPATVGYYDDGDMHTWDIVLQDGAMYTSGAVGVQSMRFALDKIGPSGTTSSA